MLGLVATVVFILLNGFVVAAEFALGKVSTTQLRGRKATEPGVARARQAVSQLERYLSVTQFGITLASLGLGWIGEPAIEHQVVRLVTWLSGGPPGSALRVVSVAVAFTLLTFGHVLFGELVPKLIAIQRSEETAVRVALPLHIVLVAFRPLLWILEKATKVILRGMGLSADAATEGSMSEEEILGILAASTARTPGGKAKGELIERVVRFATRTARNAMVPRVDVFSLPLETPGADAQVSLRKHEFTRVLLTKGRSLDEISGYLYAKDFLLDPEAERLKDLSALRRDVLFVPETQSLMDTLREMQRSNTHIAVVVDEYGGTSGIITMEDVLEEIVGEIRDEFDEEPARISKVPTEARAWDVDARATMEELRALDIEVSAEEQGETLGAVVLLRLGRLPRKGDNAELAPGVKAEVTGLSRRRVTSVRVRVSQPDQPSEP